MGLLLAFVNKVRTHAIILIEKIAKICRLIISAERMGFEPMTHFWRVHALQACSLDHSDISPGFLSFKNTGNSIVRKVIKNIQH